MTLTMAVTIIMMIMVKILILIILIIVVTLTDISVNIIEVDKIVTALRGLITVAYSMTKSHLILKKVKE